MSATIHRLHQTQPVAGYVRVGHRDHVWLEGQLARGKLPFRRFVFEAAHIKQQRGLVSALREAQCEIVLDTNFAELSSLGKYNKAAFHLPWANPDWRAWNSDELAGNRATYVASQVAEFAIEEKVDVVLAPSGLIEPDLNWLRAGVRLNEELSRVLSRVGGNRIGLDYQLISTMALLREVGFRADIKAALRDVPAENIWLRTSGFDVNATGVGTRRYSEAVSDLHQLNRPFIADMTGGFPALAATATGAISGFAHGVGQKEAFRASEYRRVAVKGGGGGAKRVFVAEHGCWIVEDKFAIMAGAKGAKSRIHCRDTACCSNGADDMIDNRNAHFLNSRASQIEQISRTPDDRRETDFLARQLGPALRVARALARLDYNNEAVAKTLNDEKKRLTLMSDVLTDMLTDAPGRSRSKAPFFRGNTMTILGQSA